MLQICRSIASSNFGWLRKEAVHASTSWAWAMDKGRTQGKGKKARAKTTVSAFKDVTKQYGGKNRRSQSISPSVQHKVHRRKGHTKKSPRNSEKKGYVAPVRNTSNSKSKSGSSPYSSTFIDAFSNLNLRDQPDLRQQRRYASNESNDHNKSKALKTTLKDIANMIANGKAKNIVVMSGAGISTGSGIPDFRTPGTGLYANLQQYRIPTPESIFDLDYFHHDPKPFFALAKELYPSGKYRPCHPHYFVRLLHQKGLLLRMYTQNIDGLERIAGIPAEKLVEAHGTFATASCTRCGKKYDPKDFRKKLFSGVIPRCMSDLCWGVVKPDIVFFGEDLPRRFYYYLKDFPQCDLLIVMGTSLEVEPFASLVNSVRSDVPRVLLNRDLVGPFRGKSGKRTRDVGFTGDLTELIKNLADLAGWKEELESVVEAEGESSGSEDEKTSSESSDSGLSSSSQDVSDERSKPSVRKPNQCSPSENNIKRYFHTIRSTPLPNISSKATSNNSNLSYYDYIRKNAPRATKT